MTQLQIFSKNEQLLFDTPPRFKKTERGHYFHISEDVLKVITGISSPENKVGFLLQLGYFRATARFFPSNVFWKRDIEYAAKTLGISATKLKQYEGTIVTRHRRRILAMLGWLDYGPSTQMILESIATRYAENRFKPKQIFWALADCCWKSRIRIPSYNELSNIITSSINAAEQALYRSLASNIGKEQIRRLEVILQPQRSETGQTKFFLAELKTISQSLKPGEICGSVCMAQQVKEHFLEFETAINQLRLSDSATEYYATWLYKADAQQLAQFRDKNKTYLHVLAFIKHQLYKRQDALVDIFLKSVATAEHAAKKTIADKDLATKKERAKALQALSKSHQTAAQLIKEVSLVVNSDKALPSEKYYKIETLIHDYEDSQDPKQLETIQSLGEQLDRELKDASYFDVLEEQSKRLQKRVSAIIKLLDFKGTQEAEPLMQAITRFRETDGRLGSSPPLDFLSKSESENIHEGGLIRTSLYKCLLFVYMAKAIKSGKIDLKHSYRFRALHDYLIDPAYWAKNKDRILKECGMQEFVDGARYMEKLKFALNQSFQDVNARNLSGQNGYLSLDASGRVKVRTPRAEGKHKEFISSALTRPGFVPILQVMREIDRLTGFSKQFTHFSVKSHKMRPTQEMLIAGLIGKGCNIGVRKIANISKGISEHNLRNVVNWYFDLSNIHAANQKIVEAIGKLALANNYLAEPDRIHSSSDGRKVGVSVDSLLANYSFKYFGKDKGVSIYTFIDERQSLFYSTVISASDREAAFVIDGLMQNDLPMQRIHSTDTHGYTETIFAATHLIGTAFAPRFRKIGQQTIYGFSTKKTYQKKGYKILPSRTINQKLILQHWDDILRFIATIKTNHTTASQLFKRLSSYAQDHPLYKALKEFGRIIKSQYILTYCDNVELRQQVQKQLNRIELANKFSHAVFFDNDQAFQVGTKEEQETATASKVLIQNSIVLWNYLYLSDIILNTDDKDERKELISLIRQGSVLTWRHINLRGEYDFRKQAANDEIFDFDRIKSLKIR